MMLFVYVALNSLEVGTGVDWNGTQGVTWVSNIYQNHLIVYFKWANFVTGKL